MFNEHLCSDTLGQMHMQNSSRCVTCKGLALVRGISSVQGFEEVPLASALAAVAHEPNSATLLDVRGEDAEG